MGNCLKIKLKGTVNNSSLPTLGAINVEFNYPNDGNNHSNRFDITVSKAMDISLISNDGATLTDLNGTPISNNIASLSANVSYSFLVTYGTGYLHIPNKYALLTFTPGGPSGRNNGIFYCDIKQFNYCTNLFDLKLQGSTNFYGDISNLLIPAFKSLYLFQTNCKGSITSMIENIYDCGYNYTSDVDAIVNGRLTYTNGSSEVSFAGAGMKIKLQNEKYVIRDYSSDNLLIARKRVNGVWINDDSVVS